jgi:predicted acyl esterase
MRLNMPAINEIAIRIATVSLALVPQIAVAAEPYAITIEHGVEARMRDGTILRPDIFRPTAPGKFPVILKRTPYDKHNEDAADFGVKGALRGYVVINQDVRGRYTSDGEWYPFLQDPDHYVYEPANPVPTIGGPLCCDWEHLAPGPRGQSAVEKRWDLLIYSTPPLEQNLEVTGPVRLELFAQSSAVDTDFTAKLVDVWPNGFAQNLTEGIVRARYRDSPEKAELMNSGKIYKFSIDLWSTSNVFLKGHRLRLEVGSSNFPRFDRNLNNGQGVGLDGAPVPATNSIYHDSGHHSALILPIVTSP